MKCTGDCMKKSSVSLIITVFLVCTLYNAVLFSPSHAHTGIATQPNMNKEFSTSDYEYEYTAHQDSIESFSETLDSNTFYTPDGFFDDTLVFASDGNDDWFRPGYPN